MRLFFFFFSFEGGKVFSSFWNESTGQGSAQKNHKSLILSLQGLSLISFSDRDPEFYLLYLRLRQSDQSQAIVRLLPYGK